MQPIGMKGLSIRIAEEADLPQLLPIAREKKKGEAFLRERLSRARTVDATWVLLQADGTIVGWGLLHSVAPDHHTYPDLEDLYIAQGHRNRGFGTFLLSEIERLARDAGHAGISLSVDPDYNPDALRFYERNSYCHDGRVKRLNATYGDFEEWTIGMDKRFPER